ncbi:MAG: CoA transferase [Solirubrobacterales bacterium]|nr:CoA transferase [Solirubrobacterales bacterium]
MSWPDLEQPRSGPLAGVRILDLSRILAGPFATQVMADLGADVIKVERTGSGDETRRWGPPFAPSGDAAYFYACNRGRRSIELDLREAADREVVLALVEEADVLMENFLPGAMERMGLSDDVLLERNPRIVHGVISGYGHSSSRAAWPALDFLIQAHAGVLAVTGPDPDHGVKAGVPIADLSAGLFATIGILAELRRVEQTGVGGRVEVALAEACASLFTNQGMNYLIGGIEPRAMGNTHPNVAPYQVVRAGDKDLAIAASSEVQFQRLCAVVGRPEWITDERFAGNAARVANRGELEQMLEAVLSTRSAADWAVAFNEAGVAAAVINSVGEMFSDPDTEAGLLAVLEEPDGPVRQIRTPIRLGGVPLPLSGPTPRLGQHTDEIREAATAANTTGA